MSVDDTRRAYLALGRQLEGFGRAHTRPDSVTLTQACGLCQWTSLQADAASISLDNETALWWAGEYPMFAELP